MSSSRLAREFTRYCFHPQVVRRFAPFHIDSSQPALGAWLTDFIDGALPHTRGDDRNTIFHIAATPEEISFRCQKCQRRLEEKDFFFTNCQPRYCRDKVRGGTRSKEENHPNKESILYWITTNSSSLPSKQYGNTGGFVNKVTEQIRLNRKT